ncbi:isochorismatase family protein [uncultured Methanospirillum sp.]|uniref:cysteine hydrolase family protein n=1 Tax=uncultured Methanospirillum sp. TaxID=262503 RepID=UPI0029C938C9|nr:isochorismatase family protein [uncultured Methanospirillum sp.]
MKKVRILHIGDMQNGFINESGHLYVSGSKELIPPTNQFLNTIKDTDFDYILVVLDTHFVEEYLQSDEGKLFPIHCEFETSDWDLSIEVPDLPHTYYILKNRFDMWSQRDETDIKIVSPQRKTVYDTLFCVVNNPLNPGSVIPRDEFISTICSEESAKDIEVSMIGVASDYCIRFAMEGWLAIDAHVTIINDLTKGIEKEITEVVSEEKYRHYLPDRLRLVSSLKYLQELSEQ